MARVSVIIPYFEQPELLAVVLDGVEQARAVASQHNIDAQVIVADDGSQQAPALGEYQGVRLVRQSDLGFRAAAARNLGARHASGDVLLFLDGDCRPEPDYIVAMYQALQSAHLVVGRRRYATNLRAWPDVEEREEPQWLLDGYADSNNLRDGRDRDYRFVISAVLAVRAADFWRWGGFDVSLIGYGGEDWDLAFRAHHAGADFVYEPAAVAWHHGPDAGARDVTPEQKNGESLALAARITDPAMRPRGMVWKFPRIIVLAAMPLSPGELAWLAERWLAGDSALYLVGGQDAAQGSWCEDPRVRRGSPDLETLLRASWVVELYGAMAPAQGMFEQCVTTPGRYDGCTVQSTRDRALGNEPGPATDEAGLLEHLTREPHLEAEWDWLR